jgi:DNA-binding SARP family transcriptional activator/TolB-like protein
VEISVQLLGPLVVCRSGTPVALPGSRKVQALLGYLAVAPRPLTRSHLCELLWDVPNDPRGELRWCLSKLRGILDEPEHRRVCSSGEHLTLNLAGCAVDALEITRSVEADSEELSVHRLRELSALFTGEFLEGLDLDRSPEFNAWLVAQRRRFRAFHVAILEQLAKALSAESAEIFPVLERWLELAPLDRQAHQMLFAAFARGDRLREGGEHLAAASRIFEAEGLDPAPLRAAWRAATSTKQAHSSASTTASAPMLVSVSEPISTPSAAPATHRASIAVMPLTDVSAPGDKSPGLADALVHDVITRLAKLRSLAVIAQGTVFALDERGIGPAAAGRMLNVDYVAGGSLRRRNGRLTVMMELAETRTAHIVWAEDFDHPLDDALLVLEEIGNRIVAAIAGEIEMAERTRALLKPPSSLNAWEAYHRGLWHMYRFDAENNDRAQHFLSQAVRLDPTFSRAHAGLSFTHFQNAFLHRMADREQEMDRALATASHALIADERDPAAHWAMGRSLWLHGRHDECVVELDRAVELSPNFAQGHYTLSFVHSQTGDPRAAIASSDHSRQLSPFDPLLFAMMGTRAMAHVRLGEFDEAAAWGAKAAARPNAHVHVRAIAAHCLAAASRLDEARAIMASIQRIRPGYDIDDFLSAFRFTPDAAAQFRSFARRIRMG